MMHVLACLWIGCGGQASADTIGLASAPEMVLDAGAGAGAGAGESRSRRRRASSLPIGPASAPDKLPERASRGKVAAWQQIFTILQIS